MPTKGAFHYPTTWQYFEASRVVGAFDDLDLQLGAEFLDPLGKRLAGVAAIHPKDAKPGKPTQHSVQYHLPSSTFRGAGWGHGHSEH